MLTYRNCLQYTHLPLLERELNIEQRLWNTHDIRKQRNAPGPFGKPDLLFTSPPEGICLSSKLKRFRKAVPNMKKEFVSSCRLCWYALQSRQRPPEVCRTACLWSRWAFVGDKWRIQKNIRGYSAKYKLPYHHQMGLWRLTSCWWRNSPQSFKQEALPFHPHLQRQMKYTNCWPMRQGLFNCSSTK